MIRLNFAVGRIRITLTFLGWLYSIAVKYGYLGAFLISIVGNLTIILPIPYTIVIYMLGSILNPLILALVCSLGSAIGELSAYVAGTVRRKFMSEKRKEMLNIAAKLVGKYGLAAVVVFAATPLPDDIILIPLGMMRYSLMKTLAACMVGKLIMSLTLTYAGKFSYVIVKSATETGGIWGTVATMIILTAIVVMSIKIDWEYAMEVVESEGWKAFLNIEKLRRVFGRGKK